MLQIPALLFALFTSACGLRDQSLASGYTLDRQSLAGFDEKDIPFLEKLVEKCIEDSVTDPTCIRKGLKGRWKFSWRNKKWAVGIHDSSFSEGLKEIGFNQCAMRAHFKDLGPKKMDMFITADFRQYMLDRQSLAGFGEKKHSLLGEASGDMH